MNILKIKPLLVEASNYSTLVYSSGTNIEFNLKGKYFRICDIENIRVLVVISEQTIFISFAGTNDLADVISVLNIFGVKTPCGSIHKGVLLSSYKVLVTEISWLISNLPESINIVVTGHSLGGALAQVFSTLICRDNINCITFGAPKIGDAIFNKNLNSKTSFNCRFILEGDLIPYLPLISYKHPNTLRIGIDGNILPPISLFQIIKSGVLGIISSGSYLLSRHSMFHYNQAIKSIKLQ